MAFGLVMLPVHSETYAQGLGGMHGFWSSYATSTFQRLMHRVLEVCMAFGLVMLPVHSRDLCTGSWRYAWLL